MTIYIARLWFSIINAAKIASLSYFLTLGDFSKFTSIIIIQQVLSIFLSFGAREGFVISGSKYKRRVSSIFNSVSYYITLTSFFLSFIFVPLISIYFKFTFIEGVLLGIGVLAQQSFDTLLNRERLLNEFSGIQKSLFTVPVFQILSIGFLIVFNLTEVFYIYAANVAGLLIGLYILRSSSNLDDAYYKKKISNYLLMIKVGYISTLDSVFKQIINASFVLIFVQVYGNNTLTGSLATAYQINVFIFLLINTFTWLKTPDSIRKIYKKNSQEGSLLSNTLIIFIYGISIIGVSMLVSVIGVGIPDKYNLVIAILPYTITFIVIQLISFESHNELIVAGKLWISIIVYLFGFLAMISVTYTELRVQDILLIYCLYQTIISLFIRYFGMKFTKKIAQSFFKKNSDLGIYTFPVAFLMVFHYVK
jgi:hypothetical protein